MAITYVQGNTHLNGGISSLTVAVALGATVGSGNILCVSVGHAGTPSVTVTDDQSNTYTFVDNLYDGTQVYSFSTFYALNIINAPQTITATFGASTQYASILVDEFSGVAASSALDGHSINNGPNTTGNHSGACTTTVNGDLVYGSAVNESGSGDITAGPGFTQALHISSAFVTEYLIQGTASSSTESTITVGNPIDYFITAVMCFKAAGGGASQTLLPGLVNYGNLISQG
jgi:hypothetical protein